MRIELNAGGLSGLVAIAEFGFSVEALDDDIDAMISSFQAVKNAVYNLEGGIGNLDEAIDSLQKRIYTEENKKHNLSDLSVRFNDFLDLAVSIDRDAAQHVRQNRDEFYRLNEHLRPVIYIEDDGWHPFRDLGEALYDLGDFIVETIVEYGDEILVVCITTVAIVGGVALIVVTGGAAAGIILGCALVGGGLGMGIAGYKSYRDDGDVELSEAFAGFGFGFAAGAAIGACIYGAGYVAATFKGWGGFLASKAISGAGTSMGMDFFSQTVVDGENVAGLENYNIKQTLLEGGKGAIMEMAVGSIFKGFDLTNKINHASGKVLSKITSVPSKSTYILSRMPANFVEGTVNGLLEQGVDQGVAALSGEEIPHFDGGKFAISVLCNVLFGAVADSFEFDRSASKIYQNINESRVAREASGFESYASAENAIETRVAQESQQAADTAARIRQNIEESRIAREASNFGTKDLSYREYPISKKGVKQVLKQRGLTDIQADQVISSFDGDITVKHTRPGGEMKWVYSDGNGGKPASGIFTTSDVYYDNMTAIEKLAAPSTNSMLQAEKVIIHGDQINGKVAPQYSFTADAVADGSDSIIRRGGGTQTVTNGGFESGAVKRTGETSRLFNTANRIAVPVGGAS